MSNFSFDVHNVVRVYKQTKDFNHFRTTTLFVETNEGTTEITLFSRQDEPIAFIEGEPD